MKLVITDPSLDELGGAERVVIKIAQKYDAKIYTFSYNKHSAFSEFGDLDVEVLKNTQKLSRLLPKQAAAVAYHSVGFYNAKITDDYDVLNAHGLSGAFVRHRNERVLWYLHEPRLLNSKLKKKPLLSAMFDETFNRMFAAYQSSSARKIEAIVVNGTNTKNGLKRYLGMDGTVINPGTDYERFRNSGDGKYFLCVSRIDPWKRQEYAIEAFSRFMRLAKTSKHKLVIAGDLTFPDYLSKLKSMRVKNVIFKQNVADRELIRLYANATAVLFTAINEDFGIVPLEGMASSKPVISVNEGGPTETVLNGKTGFLVNSPSEMAERMKYVVEHESIARAMGKAGRKRVVAKYSWEQFFKKFDLIARKVSKMGSIRAK